MSFSCWDIAVCQLQVPDHNINVQVHLGCSVCELSILQSWPTFNRSNYTLSGSGRQKKTGGMFNLKKTGTFLEGRRKWRDLAQTESKALVDACHLPLRLLWLAFVVLETANSCMQMAMLPQGWPLLFWVSVWQGRFLLQHKGGCSL